LKAEDFKKEVVRILGAELQFDGHVGLVVSSISEDRQKSILFWIKQSRDGEIKP
jgi:hypothetical protein